MIICETIQMMESLQAAVDEIEDQRREEFIEAEEEQTYVFAGNEFTRKELMCYLETVVNMQQISDQSLAGTMMRVKKKLNEG